jgi:hypothetical protein
VCSGCAAEENLALIVGYCEQPVFDGEWLVVFKDGSVDVIVLDALDKNRTVLNFVISL